MMEIIGDRIVIGRAVLIGLANELKFGPPGLLVFIGGGAARDQLHGLAPKDIDIALVQADEESVQTAHDFLESMGWEMVKLYDRDETNTYADNFDEDEDRFVEIRQYVHMETHADLNCKLDLLVYHERYETIQDVMDSHDHTINQFAAWWDPETKTVDARYFGDFNQFGACYQIRKNVTPERIERVKVICGMLGWDYAGAL